MLEALWTVEFEVAGGWENGGVLVFETGRIFGGDSQYYYLGTFFASEGSVTAELRVTHYHGPPQTAWGDAARDFQVTAQGRWQGDDTIVGTMTRAGHPRPLNFRLRKRSELP
jgi:hypothetical protein